MEEAQRKRKGNSKKEMKVLKTNQDIFRVLLYMLSLSATPKSIVHIIDPIDISFLKKKLRSYRIFESNPRTTQSS